MTANDFSARRAARDAHAIALELSVVGSVVRSRADWSGTAQDWTALALAAESALRRPVASGFSRRTGAVWATLLDWPNCAAELLTAARRNKALTARLGATTVLTGAGIAAHRPTA